ncbi:MAG: ABC transporter substrate-binding protein [Helicobacter sp.]|nr:ABC transporter substrate-binding protein [Helicobacter sp.]
MQERIDESLQILKTQKNVQVAANEIFAFFDPIFDFKLMAQLSLSNEYKKLTQEQQQQFIKSFEKSLKENFISKVKLYKDEKMNVIGGTQTKNNRYELKSSIILDGKENYIIFKFYESNKDWKIYDVDILGVSLIQTYRSQFADILKQSDFQTLIQKLENEIKIDTQ